MNRKVRADQGYIDSGTNRLYCRVWSNGDASPTIVFLHGLGFHSFEYDDLAPLVARGGFNCVAFDFRGHGRSTGRRGYWTLRDLVDDTRRVVDHISGKYGGGIGVFGNSLGAIAGVYAASEDERIGSLVASGCPTRPREFILTPVKVLLLYLTLAVERLVPYRISVNHFIPYRRIFTDPKRIERVKRDDSIADARRFAPSTYGDMYRWDATQVVGNLSIPLLVLHGKHDKLEPVGQSELLYEAAREPKEMMVLDTGHLPNIENHRMLGDLTVRWFEKTLGRSDRAGRRIG